MNRLFFFAALLLSCVGFVTAIALWIIKARLPQESISAFSIITWFAVGATNALTAVGLWFNVKTEKMLERRTSS